jgi:cytochrome c553
MKRASAVLIGLLISQVASPAAPAVAPSADVAQGRARSLGCQACHGAAGVGISAEIPNLAGQKTAYLEAQLDAFRSGERKHELMNAIATQLSDADVANLAAFWNSLPTGAAVAHDGADPAAQFRKSRMTFPAGFPKEFVQYAEAKDAVNVLSARSYVSRAALAAARAGKPLPHGSIIVVENYANGAVASYAAMESRAGFGDGVPEVLKNGDWSYALFDAKQELRQFNYAKCLACHKPKADTSFVFGLAQIAAAK